MRQLVMGGMHFLWKGKTACRKETSPEHLTTLRKNVTCSMCLEIDVKYPLVEDEIA